MKTCFCTITTVVCLLAPSAFAQGARLLTTFTNPNPANAETFGYSVAPMGRDRVLIGAFGGNDFPGVAYLLSTNGTLLTTFTNPATQLDDYFGIRMAAVGSDRVFVAATYASTMGNIGGAAYLFDTNGTLLTTFANPAPSGDDEFGTTVAVIGSDRIVIGALPYAANKGSVYLFSTDGTLVTTFTNPVPAVASFFGISIGVMSSDRVLIGALGAGAAAGAAYLFSTNGTLLTTFTNPPLAGGDWFGYGVATVGDHVFVGAPAYVSGAGSYSGQGYLFNTNGTLITTFTNPTPAGYDFFGGSVAAVGTDRVLIGVSEDDTGVVGAGAAYLFSTNGTLLNTFTNPVPVFSSRFADRVAALDSDHVLIGSEDEKAYLFSIETEVPRLSLTHSSGNMIISWPNAIGFTLQSTPQLSPTSWVDVTNAPALIGGNWAVTNSLSGSNKFYRLRKP